MVKSFEKMLQNKVLNCPVTYSYIFTTYTLGSFFHSMSRFLETDIREKQKYEKRIQTSAYNTGNDLHHEIKFKNCVKNKNNFLLKQNISFLF